MISWRIQLGRRSSRAFTLIELLVVLAIIAALSALAFPAVSRVVQSSRSTACFANLHNLGAALNLYLGDHNQMLPTLQTGRASITDDIPVIDTALAPYIHDARAFACPADNAHIATATGTSYAWNNAINGQSISHLQFFNSIGDNSRIPVMYDKQAFHPYESNKVNFLYADGHASAEFRFSTSK